jgi:DNA-binding SARP family transcriptional activator/DNA-binding beta-propeller fold protein YncE
MMEFRVLGPLEVVGDDGPLSLGGSKERAVLAFLLLHRGEEVSRDRLVDALWGERPPPTVTTSLQVRISRLRRVLGEGVVATRGSGYAVELEPGQLDLERFERLVARGRELLASGDAAEAAEALRAAGALWRGPPLADFAQESWAQNEIARLDELYLAGVEERIEAELALGQEHALAPELEALVRQHPLRERLRGQLMVALYRSGRQAEALNVYRDFRRTLRDDLGLAPGPRLQQLEREILNQDPALAPPRQRPSFAAPRSSGIMLLLGGILVVIAATVAAIVAATRGSAEVAVARNSLAVLDAKNGDLIADVPLASAPAAVAAGFGSIWVAGDDRTLTRIDPGERRIRKTIGLPHAPIDVAAGSGAVWILGTSALSRVDPAFDAVVDTLHLPPVRSGDLGFEEHAALAVGEGGVWVTAPASTVLRIDPRSNRIGRRIVLDNTVAEIAAGAGAVWVGSGSPDENTITKIDPKLNAATARVAVGRIVEGPLATAAGAIDAAAGSVWVAATGDGTVWRIDASNELSRRSIRVGATPLGLSAGEGAAWVTKASDGSVSQIDPRQEEAVRTIRVGNVSSAIASAYGRVWVGVR